MCHRTLLILGGGYVALCLWSFWGEFGHATTSRYADSSEYADVTRLSITSLDFYTWFKPWGLPLFYKVLPGSTAVAAPIAQSLVSVASWLVLAAVVQSCVRSRIMRVGAPALVLAFSLVPAIKIWDGAILTESLTISVAVLLVAALLECVRRPTRVKLGLVLVAAAALAVTRDTNAYVQLALLGPVSVYFLCRRQVATAVAFASATLLLVVVVSASANVRRWEVPLGVIIAGRVLHNDEARAYFVARGMPVRPSLEQDLWSSRVPLSRYETDPSLAYFRPWFKRRGRAVYRSYLVSHPHEALVEPVKNLPSLIAPSGDVNDLQALPIDFYRPQGYRDALPKPVARFLYLNQGGVLIAWAAIALVTAATLAWFGVARRVWIVPAVTLASTIPHAIVVWDGDPTSLGRHALLLAVLMRLSLVLLVIFIVDAAASVMREERRAAAID
jgi:hypothetical protein